MVVRPAAAGSVGRRVTLSSSVHRAEMGDVGSVERRGTLPMSGQREPLGTRNFRNFRT